MLGFLHTETQRKEAVDSLITESRTNFNYYVLLGVSTLITTLGLTLDNNAVVIGGMLIAPLLTPILALGLGITTISRPGTIRSLVGIINSVTYILLFSFLLSLLIHDDNYVTEEILLRSTSSHLYFFIAFLSGIGATFAWVQKKVAYTLPGVAVAVSLLPPLCVSGIALAQADPDLLINSLSIFFLNFVGIVLASTMVFIFFKFKRLKHFEEKKISKEENGKD